MSKSNLSRAVTKHQLATLIAEAFDLLPSNSPSDEAQEDAETVVFQVQEMLEATADIDTAQNQLERISVLKHQKGLQTSPEVAPEAHCVDEDEDVPSGGEASDSELDITNDYVLLSADELTLRRKQFELGVVTRPKETKKTMEKILSYTPSVLPRRTYPVIPSPKKEEISEGIMFDTSGNVPRWKCPICGELNVVEEWMVSKGHSGPKPPARGSEGSSPKSKKKSRCILPNSIEQHLLKCKICECRPNTK